MLRKTALFVCKTSHNLWPERKRSCFIQSNSQWNEIFNQPIFILEVRLFSGILVWNCVFLTISKIAIQSLKTKITLQNFLSLYICFLSLINNPKCEPEVFLHGFVLLCQVFQVMRKQEDTRLAETAAEKAHFEAIQANADIVSDYAFHSHHLF